MTKPESLRELVERLDKEFVRGVAAGEACSEDASWPRIRDSIMALREFVLETAEGQEPSSYDASDLLARLDKGEAE